MTRVPDTDLHARILVGDEQALATFDGQLGPRVIGWLKKNRGDSYEDAEEAWSTALEYVARNIAQVEPSKLSGYAFKAAIRQAASRRRKEARRVEADALSLEDYMTDKDVEQQADAPESPILQRLRDCLEAASERVRLVARLMEIGASAKEIAQAFNVKEDSAYQLKSRTMKALRKCLEGGA